MVAIDPHYGDPTLAALYDLDSPWAEDTDFYCRLAADLAARQRAGSGPFRILDIGCGTGTLTCAFAAAGHRVTGVDPASAMLAIARAKPGSAAVTWRLGTAATLANADAFDLVTLTGHAFQVLLDDAELAATLAAIRRLLGPGGTLAFESRAPTLDWRARWDGLRRTWPTREGTVTKTLAVIDWQVGRMRFRQRYVFAGGAAGDFERVSESVLAFRTRDEIVAALAVADFPDVTVLGSWQGEPVAAESEEMIFLAR